jgi:hypothetical protein
MGFGGFFVLKIVVLYKFYAIYRAKIYSLKMIAHQYSSRIDT